MGQNFDRDFLQSFVYRMNKNGQKTPPPHVTSGFLEFFLRGRNIDC